MSHEPADVTPLLPPEGYDPGYGLTDTEQLAGKMLNMLAQENDALLTALKEALSFENEDTDCLIGRDAVPVDVCIDGRCKDHGCMVARVNRWRAVIAKIEGRS